MKKLISMTAIIIITACLSAQPQKMSYQAVIRNNSGQLVTSHSIGMRISILQGSASGTAVYVETQTPTTNANGLATVEIGNGTVVSGTFSAINWASGIYYLKTETDPAGGTSYTITGTSQLLSTPYALYAKTAGNGSLWTQNGAKISYNAGDVGIGISNPAAFLNVFGNCDLNHPLLLLTENQDDYARMMFKSVAFPTKNWSISGAFWPEDWMSTLNFYYSNGTTGNNLVSICGNGNVGIGTDDPIAKLEVAGQMKITGGAPGEGKILTSDAGGLASWQVPGPWLKNGADIFFNTGKIGIGTNVPQALLSLSGNSDPVNPHLLITEVLEDYTRIMFKNTSSPTKDWTIASISRASDDNSVMNFYYNNGTTGKNIMTVEGSGRVGIGTSLPARLLHVYGTGNPRILIESPDQAPELNLQRGSTTHALYVNGSYDLTFFCGGDIMALTHDGKLGIGTTTPNYTLDVRGTIGNNTTLYHSDMRWKTDIKPIKYGVSDLLKLNSVSYLWNTNDYPEMGFDNETQLGFIAQEFEKVIPELVRTDEQGFKSIDYVKLTPVLVEAIKEQQKQIDELKQLVQSLINK